MRRKVGPSWCIWDPHFGEGEVVGGQRYVAIRKSDLVSYRLSIVTIALSVTIRPQYAGEYLQRSNHKG